MSSISNAEAIKSSSTWRGSLLITGTCIGGGMIAMPMQTGEMGFFLSLIVLLITWAFMTFTGLLLVEVSGWFKNGSHFSSMAEALLGKAGKGLSLAIYLFMNCASLVAYTSGGAVLINQWAADLFGFSLGYASSCMIFTLILGGIIPLGITFVGRLNAWMTLMMGVIYCCLILMGACYLNSEYLVFRSAWVSGLSSFPLIIAAFSYQMIVPTLCSYLNYEVKDLKKSIVVGTSIPFVVYLLWLLIIHGIIPFEGAYGLKESFVNGSMIVKPLKAHLSGGLFFVLIDGFAFLALSTSYIGLSLALFDFVRDLFKEATDGLSKNKITFLSLAPSLILAIFFSNGLLDFLDVSGGFGDSLLSGLIPIAMVWIGRYKKRLNSDYQTPGGRWALYTAASFALFIFVFQWIKLIWKF